MTSNPEPPKGEYDWKRFSAKSDARYKAALTDGNIASLASHNIIKDGPAELVFIFDLARLYFGETPVRGRALDVCCGAGYMTDCLRAGGFEATGFDLNADAVNLAAQRFPDCRFLVGDATKPKVMVGEESFDLILIREAHPFSRIDDPDFQFPIVRDYLDLLGEGGLMAIAHARKGGGMRFPSLNFARLALRLRTSSLVTAGPVYYFLMKQINVRPKHKTVVAILSWATGVLRGLTGQRWIEIFLVKKGPVV